MLRIKRTVVIILCLLCIASSLPFSTVEVRAASDNQAITFEDGSYLLCELLDASSYEADENERIDDVVGLYQEENEISLFYKLLTRILKILSFFSRAKTVEKVKYLKYYDKNGVLLWTVTLYAQFSYSRSSVKCESAKLSSSILDSDWKMTEAKVSKNKNTAIGAFTISQSKLGIPLKSISRTLTLTCDKNGNIT